MVKHIGGLSARMGRIFINLKLSYMRKLLFLLLMFITLPACAQRIDKPGEPYDYYIEIKIEQRLTENIKAKIKLPEDKTFKYLVDENGKRITFVGINDIINYMTMRGWTYVNYENYINEQLLLFRKNVINNTYVKEYILVGKD